MTLEKESNVLRADVLLGPVPFNIPRGKEMKNIEPDSKYTDQAFPTLTIQANNEQEVIKK